MWFALGLLALGLASAQADHCPLDICFVVDESASINRINWEGFIRPFLLNIVNALSNDDVHVGIVTFNNDAAVDLYLTHVTSGSVFFTIMNLEYNGGLTNLRAGLELCKNEVFVEANGDRPGVQNVVVMISDGVPTITGPPLPIADMLKDMGVLIYSVAVGVADSSLLAAISSNNMVISVEEFGDLDNILQDLIDLLCPPVIPPTTEPTLPPEPSVCLGCDGSIWDNKQEPNFGGSLGLPMEWQYGLPNGENDIPTTTYTEA